jgi:hypothetical protein
LQKSAVGDIGSDESIPRESCCCEIALFIDHYRRHICHHCGGENSEAVWMGTLSDSMSVLVGHPSEIAVISSDDTVGNREGMVPRLQMLARKHGYTYCEVRNYSASDPFDYVPLYGGPLPLLSPTS